MTAEPKDYHLDAACWRRSTQKATKNLLLKLAFDLMDGYGISKGREFHNWAVDGRYDLVWLTSIGIYVLGLPLLGQGISQTIFLQLFIKTFKTDMYSTLVYRIRHFEIGSLKQVYEKGKGVIFIVGLFCFACLFL